MFLPHQHTFFYHILYLGLQLCDFFFQSVFIFVALILKTFKKSVHKTATSTRHKDTNPLYTEDNSEKNLKISPDMRNSTN